MGPSQQFGVSMERPSHNRRPVVTFERPSHFNRHLEISDYVGPDSSYGSYIMGRTNLNRTAEASNYLRENLAAFMERESAIDKQQFYRKSSPNQELLVNLLANNNNNNRQLVTMDPVKSLPVSQNSLPKPYSKQGGEQQVFGNYGPQLASTSRCRPVEQQQQATKSSLSFGNLSQQQYQQINEPVQQQQYQQASPRILVNDKPVLCRYPTSTVHKSMLNSNRSGQLRAGNCCQVAASAAAAFDQHQHTAAYSRLISPTMQSGGGSISPSQSSLESSMINEPMTSGNAPLSEQQTASQKVELPEFPLAQRASRHNGEAHQMASAAAAAALLEGSESVRNLSRLTQDVAANQQASAANNDSFYYSAKQRDQDPRAILSNPPNSSYTSLLPASLKQKQPTTSAIVCPDNKRAEFMWNRQLERVSIAHQTYRTLPIVTPKPKARHDLATGTYMNYGQDLSYELALQSRPSSRSSREHERKIQQAIDEANGEMRPSHSHSHSHSPLPLQATASTRFGGLSEASANTKPAALTTTTTSSTSGLRQASSTSTTNTTADLVPAFNYREYIESTRRAH